MLIVTLSRCHCHDSSCLRIRALIVLKIGPYGIPIFGYLRFSSYLCIVRRKIDF